VNDEASFVGYDEYLDEVSNAIREIESKADRLERQTLIPKSLYMNDISLR